MKRMDEDGTSALLKKILSPADAQSLVMPPPDHAPRSGPAESTPLTGNLAAPPSQATPSRDHGDAAPRTGLAAWFAEQGRSGRSRGRFTVCQGVVTGSGGLPAPGESGPGAADRS